MKMPRLFIVEHKGLRLGVIDNDLEHARIEVAKALGVDPKKLKIEEKIVALDGKTLDAMEDLA